MPVAARRGGRRSRTRNRRSWTLPVGQSPRSGRAAGRRGFHSTRISENRSRNPSAPAPARCHGSAMQLAATMARVNAACSVLLSEEPLPEPAQSIWAKATLRVALLGTLFDALLAEEEARGRGTRRRARKPRDQVNGGRGIERLDGFTHQRYSSRSPCAATSTSTRAPMIPTSCGGTICAPARPHRGRS